MQKITKLFSNSSVKSIDEDKRQATFIISTDEKDRYDEIVEQSWDLAAYKQNPIVLFGHNSWEADAVMGKAIEIETKKDGDRTITTGTVQFADAGTSQTADTVWSLVKQQILKTVSVGFIPHTFKDGGDTGADAILADNELLEFSIVPIPANPQAVALAFGDGSIKEKDAKWLLKAYKAEQEYLEKSLYDTMKPTTKNNDNQERAKVMTEEDKKAMAEAIEKAVSDAVTPLAAEVKTLSEKLATKAEEDEAAAAAEAAKAEEDKEDPAKSEHEDEDGAGDAEEKEDDELDEEAEKAYLESLEKDYKELEGKE